MSTFTSSQNGLWSAASTWDGGVVPENADDIVNIQHSVIYDLGEHSNSFGNITVEATGSFIFPSNSNSILNFNATAKLNITGSFVTDGTLQDVYFIKINWEQGNTFRDAITYAATSIVSLLGNTRNVQLPLAANWNAASTNTFYLTGDQTLSWALGSKLYLEKKLITTYVNTSNYKSGGTIFTIASIGGYDAGLDRTPITVTAGHGSTDTFTGEAYHLSQNIQIGDITPGFTVNPVSPYYKLLKGQVTNGASLTFQGCLFVGWYSAFTNTTDITLTHTAFLNNYTCFYNAEDIDVTATFISNYYCFIKCNRLKFTGTMQSCFTGFLDSNFTTHTGNATYLNIYAENCNTHTLTGDATNNVIVGKQFTNGEIHGKLVSNYIVFKHSNNITIIGEYQNCYSLFEYCSHMNNICSVTNCTYKHIKSDFINFASSLLDSVLTEYSVFNTTGLLQSIVATDTFYWRQPVSSSSFIIRVIPNNLTAINPLPFFTHPVYLQDGMQKQLKIRIYLVGYDVNNLPDNNSIWCELEYTEGQSLIQQTTKNTAQAFVNNFWQEILLDITPNMTGLAKLTCFTTAYEDGAYFLLDPGSGV